jgi:hypothetical protein
MYRYATHIGLGPAYSTNEEVNRLVKMAIALAFLPSNKARDDFQQVVIDLILPPSPKGQV